MVPTLLIGYLRKFLVQLWYLVEAVFSSKMLIPGCLKGRWVFPAHPTTAADLNAAKLRRQTSLAHSPAVFKLWRHWGENGPGFQCTLFAVGVCAQGIQGMQRFWTPMSALCSKGLGTKRLQAWGALRISCTSRAHGILFCWMDTVQFWVGCRFCLQAKCVLVARPTGGLVS